MPALDIQSVTKSYNKLRVLDRVSAQIDKGELVTLLGPSGCGKTTLLRSIAGLADIDEGRIVLEGRDVTKVPIHKRGIAMVFQSHALFPHMSVADNVAFGLKMQGVGKAEREDRVKRALSLVRLDAYLTRMPHELSGGQQQRVAIARAIVTNPTALLLDEPFGALDRKLRETLQVELRRLTKELGITAIFVTHDQEEAVVLSDRVAVMNAGVIQQIAPAVDVYENPANEFVANFMGFQNIFDAKVRSAQELAIGDTVIATDKIDVAPGEGIRMAIRAERVSITAGHREGAIPGQVSSSTYLGEQNAYVVDTADGPVTARIPTSVARFSMGEAVSVSFDPAAVRVLAS
ncbi:putative spermidine/putrescine transport system ATP-binding protein/spermidine/putrescine transport system ATP-binding protein [Devosia sp. YR412]|uniref:ABC transporter ATP-binding protein n=1 Tax=Devosia sp. YR412 TaxID=1881030 RepID=UPI0008D144D3|nr:ABC transporter ATP-binding protein [Devosia sp. YR412]SEQ48953.1 putative spermidine/putrescine transport system ATP-binding protein/spermidine/putrescine transport system ATP-binding protein [Devosia sp. YR412]